MSDTWVPAEVVTSEDVSRRRRRRSGGAGDLAMALVFIIPATIGFLVFYMYPSIRGFYFSLTRYNLLGSPHFIGFDNYVRLVNDKLFWNALLVTVEYVLINIGLQTILAVGIAVLMHRLTKSTLVRGLILMPFLISNVIAALLWFWLLDYQIGLVNEFISSIGLGADCVLRRWEVGDPDHRIRQRLAAHGLHRLAGFRRITDHSFLHI